MRRRSAPKRQILPDPLFHSQILAKFINVLMLDGKKSIAEKVIYGALDLVLKRHKGQKTEGGEAASPSRGSIRTDDSARTTAIKLFEEVLEKLRPRVEVKSRRVGGATYQVPIEVRADRSTALAMRWLVEYSRKRGEKGMMQRLAAEMLDTLQDRGGAFKKRDDVHKMAKANQAFAHYRW